jgi:hypothetical protein
MYSKSNVIVSTSDVNLSLSHFLCYRNNQCESFSISQLLLYIEKEDEVKKNQIIKEIFYVMNLLNQQNQLIVMNFTKAIANNVDELTIHSSLNIEINKQIFKITRERVRRL